MREELTKIEICEKIWWIIEILCLGYPSPMEKVEKLKNDNQYVLMNGIYLAKILRALSSNIYFCIFAKSQYSIATKLCVKLMNNCTIFLNKK